MQIKSLIKNIRKYVKDKKFPILIDEEGATVSRLINLINHNFEANYFGNLYKVDKKIAIKLYKNYLKSICDNLKKIGININTVPVLDVLRGSTHKIIGTRSYSYDPKTIQKLGKICVKQFEINKIATVIKHIPGHGCALLDSHLKTPKVNLNFSKLNKIDFTPFKSNQSKFAMTAHIIYKKIDNLNVATFSQKVIKKIIRKKIGFPNISYFF